MKPKKEALAAIRKAAEKAMLGNKYRGEDKPMLMITIGMGKPEEEEELEEEEDE